jgi:hypothetical protein
MLHLTTDDGVSLNCEEARSGAPVIFVHEFAGDHQLGAAGSLPLATLPLYRFNARGWPPP